MTHTVYGAAVDMDHPQRGRCQFSQPISSSRRPAGLTGALVARVVLVYGLKMHSAARALFVVGFVATGLLSLSPSAWLIENSLDTPSVSLTVDQWLSAAKHISVYAVLAFVGVFAFSAPRNWVWLGIGLFSYGLGLEAAQMFVAGRTSDVLDVLANGVGIGIGLWAARSMLNRRPTGLA